MTFFFLLFFSFRSSLSTGIIESEWFGLERPPKVPNPRNEIYMFWFLLFLFQFALSSCIPLHPLFPTSVKEVKLHRFQLKFVGKLRAALLCYICASQQLWFPQISYVCKLSETGTILMHLVIHSFYQATVYSNKDIFASLWCFSYTNNQTYSRGISIDNILRCI